MEAIRERNEPVLTLLHHSPQRSCDGIARRDFLRAGTLSRGGLSLPWLLQTQAIAATERDYVKDKAVDPKELVRLIESGKPIHELI